MNESVSVKKITKKTLELNQSEIETLIKDWLGDSANTEWNFDFDFDNYVEVTARVTRTITTEETYKENQ